MKVVMTLLRSDKMPLIVELRILRKGETISPEEYSKYNFKVDDSPICEKGDKVLCVMLESVVL
jgi:hypothetical protein